MYWGTALTAVKSSHKTNTTATLLEFNDLTTNTKTTVHADTTLLNIPGKAIDSLDPDSVIFTDSPPATVEKIESITNILGVKVYANYENAWWYNDLGLMTGDYADDSTTAPLFGKYNDGPTKCVTGYGADGTPIYSGTPVAYGNCTGALLVLYTNFIQQDYYTQLMTSPSNPLTVISADSENAYVLDEIHESLMQYHADIFEEAGIDPKTISKPLNIFIGNWIEDAPYSPGIGSFPAADMPYSDASATVRKPSSTHSVYVTNQDYGYVDRLTH